ncbi:MAG: ABC transporter permease [Clostridiales Family XIII bacterium]|jgi:ribose/xylose/arabinose/galactoside ABC-type transport system permease subunit|nr:ABC transporter permease [Clostridiales Family XIII bacterium]
MRAQAMVRHAFRSKYAALLLAVFVVFLVFFLLKNTYLGGNNIRSMMNAMSLSGMLSAGMAILLISGEIDLSSGAVAMFAGIVCAFCLQAGLPIPVAVCCALLFGALAGLFNAFLVNAMNLMSFIATIGMASVYTGLAYFLTDAKGISVNGAILKLGGTALAGIIPVPFVLTLVVIALYAFILKYTDVGRKVYMVGGNRAAARLAGISPKRITTAVFVNNGIIAALAGICLMSRMHVANPAAASTGALEAITAAVLGGVSFAGGVGGMGGCLIGLVLLNAFSNGLTGVGLPTFYQLIAQGVLLIIALSVDYLSAGARQRWLAGEAQRPDRRA